MLQLLDTFQFLHKFLDMTSNFSGKVKTERYFTFLYEFIRIYTILYDFDKKSPNQSLRFYTNLYDFIRIYTI